MRRRAIYTSRRLASLTSGVAGPLRGYVSSTPREAPEFVTHLNADGTFVATIPNGRCLFDYGVVVDPGRRLYADISPQLGSPPWTHEALYRTSIPTPPTHLDGRVAVLTSTAHQRYYHWMFDVLPRLGILRDAGVECDRFIANRDQIYQRETLSRLGIDDRLISPSIDSHFQATELIVPSLPGETDRPTKRSYDFLRHWFLPDIVDHGRKLYISRSDAATRRLENEREVIALLVDHGFEIHALDGMSVADQARLFASASAIFAPHGAGLTNIVFSHPGTQLVEFMPDGYFNGCFEVLAGLGGLSYERIECRTTDARTQDFIVDIDLVKDALSSHGSAQPRATA